MGLVGVKETAPVLEQWELLDCDGSGFLDENDLLLPSQIKKDKKPQRSMDHALVLEEERAFVEERAMSAGPQMLEDWIQSLAAKRGRHGHRRRGAGGRGGGSGAPGPGPA